MFNKDVPHLCGGTFFVLLLRTKRTRTKKEIRISDNGGVTNPELLKNLILFLDPDLTVPKGSSFETNTSLYKSCDISFADCLPFSDVALVKEFDRKIHTAYCTELSKMKLLVEFFLTTEKPAKMNELVWGILNLIKDDNTIGSHEIFYALPDGTPICKVDLLETTEINLYALLLGVWHFILVNRADNSIGKSTLAEWLSPPTEKGSRHTFVSPIGDAYHLDIKISTTCENTDSAKEENDACDDNPAVDYAEAKIIEDIPAAQSVPTIMQNVQNQFNINQSGSGINIGYAEKVEIRNGKVVTLK